MGGGGKAGVYNVEIIHEPISRDQLKRMVDEINKRAEASIIATREKYRRQAERYRAAKRRAKKGYR